MSARGDIEDVLNQQLIAHLIEKEQALVAAAEEILLNYALIDSQKSSKTFHHNETNLELPVRSISEDATHVSDESFAQFLQTRSHATMNADQQLARRLAAEEKTMLLDQEFARRLQDIDSDQEDMDEEGLASVEDVLHQEEIDWILEDAAAQDPNIKGKGKPLATNTIPEPVAQLKIAASLPPVCGICDAKFLSTANPSRVSVLANSSTRLPYGLILPCPASHPYCLACLKSFIESKLNDGRNGTIVFPIRCPGCPVYSWSLTDEVAVKVLEKDGIVQWHYQKLLESIPRFYCPNQRCSERLEVDEDGEEAHALCPSCNFSICIPCKTLWHSNMTCEQYQDLPIKERNPDDYSVLQLAKAKNWHRCPKCKVIVELTSGCNHISCNCGQHFCFKCGSDWNILKRRCTREPPCELWDEDMLLEENEREMEDVQANAGGMRPHEGHNHVPFVEQTQVHRVRDMNWLNNPGPLHPSTKEMTTNLTCVYCRIRLGSIAQLVYHLSNQQDHAVWACCGQFFRRRTDLDKHRIIANKARKVHWDTWIE